MKFLASVLLSVVLSVSAVLGLHVHYRTQVADITAIKSAAHSLQGVIYSPFGPGVGSCSAVAIAPHILLTAAHCEMADLKVDGSYSTKLIKIDRDADLMLLYSDVGGGFVPVSSGAELKSGDKVVTYGFPFGLFVGYVPVFTEGTVQGYVVGEEIYGTNKLSGWVMSVLPIAGGNSGGGIFKRVNGEWRVVSIVSLGANHLSISPSLDMVKKFTNG